MERAHGVQQLCLAVANGLGGQRVGRLHRHEREHLEQVVLDDVAQRPSLLVVAAAAVDTGGLGDRDLDVVDHLSRPGPLDHRVREPEDKDVLHRLLAEVMVDAEDLRLVEDLAHDATELAGARQVVPDRLLQHDPRVLLEARFADAANDRWEGRGRRAAIEQRPASAVLLAVERHEMLAERGEGARGVELRGDVGQRLRERLPTLFDEPVAGELHDRRARTLAKACVVEGASPRPHNRVTLGSRPSYARS